MCCSLHNTPGELRYKISPDGYTCRYCTSENEKHVPCDVRQDTRTVPLLSRNVSTANLACSHSGTILSQKISIYSLKKTRLWGSSFSVVSHYILDNRVRSPAEATDFSSSLCVQTSSGVHPAPYPVGTVLKRGQVETLTTHAI
jgi:hypothetical protein